MNNTNNTVKAVVATRSGYWGQGSSLAEAVAQCRKAGASLKDPALAWIAVEGTTSLNWYGDGAEYKGEAPRKVFAKLSELKKMEQ